MKNCDLKFCKSVNVGHKQQPVFELQQGTANKHRLCKQYPHMEPTYTIQSD